MTRGSESERFAIEMNGFIDIMRRRSLINAKLRAIRDVQNGQTLEGT